MAQNAHIPEDLYHILLTTSHISKNPNNVVEKVRVLGSYTSLIAAKAAAHSCLYDAGYEEEFFKTYEINPGRAEKEQNERDSGVIIHASAADGTIFRVRIKNSPNEALALTSDLPDGRVSVPLYYVIQASVEYGGDDGSLVRDIDVEGAFASYAEARKFASTVLLSPEDGITKDSFAEYSEAGPDETDCGYGENVIVHAASEYGTNYLVNVVKTLELKAVGVAEAAMRIR
ncbi:uncharacterized protein TRUGW13939_10498 [Talaromyces rugulosus]|uniref:Uncharacterized protein n=1 Tax=Talaromyces rugulosus TaxID=121627 RepID=A0A7H8RBD4_TALRU|nr:uncharacterized protein TRUGW13939_10498 [Talaromyces rugulosus]QKX63328.1 hypothetical protein TRUGW13939_10498 [Talaromyces rugulosus]